MKTGVFITATDTGSGKTYVSSTLLRHLKQRGLSIAARKPIESGATMQDGQLVGSDAALHASITGEPLSLVCPYPLHAAISPDLAAQLEGKAYYVDDLRTACYSDADFTLVEGAGGFYSPLCRDGLNADLAAAVGLPVVLVVGDRLGCINHTLLSIQAIASRGLKLAAVVLSQVPGNERPAGMDNYTELLRYLSAPLIVAPTHDTQFAELLAETLL